MPDKHEVGGSSPLGPTRRESVKAFTARYSREAVKLDAESDSSKKAYQTRERR